MAKEIHRDLPAGADRLDVYTALLNQPLASQPCDSKRLRRVRGEPVLDHRAEGLFAISHRLLSQSSRRPNPGWAYANKLLRDIDASALRVEQSEA